MINRTQLENSISPFLHLPVHPFGASYKQAGPPDERQMDRCSQTEFLPLCSLEHQPLFGPLPKKDTNTQSLTRMHADIHTHTHTHSHTHKSQNGSEFYFSVCVRMEEYI